MYGPITIAQTALDVQNEFDYVNRDDRDGIIEFLSGDAEMADAIIKEYSGYQREEIVRKAMKIALEMEYRLSRLEK